jgi:hypothetical protein
VALGAAFATALPTRAIGIGAGIAFLGFAAWTLRGDRLTDDERARAARPARNVVLAVGTAFFLAELGDKTMIATVTLAPRGRLRHLDRLHDRPWWCRRPRHRGGTGARQAAPAAGDQPLRRRVVRVLRVGDARRGAPGLKKGLDDPVLVNIITSVAARPHVVIVGAGFAGIDCAKRLTGERSR